MAGAGRKPFFTECSEFAHDGHPGPCGRLGRARHREKIMVGAGGERTPGFQAPFDDPRRPRADHPALFGLAAGLRPPIAIDRSDRIDHRRLGRPAGNDRAGAGDSLSRDRDRNRRRERAERHAHQPGHPRADPRARGGRAVDRRIDPQVRKRSIYEAVVYDAQVKAVGALRLPAGPRAHRSRAGADGPFAGRAALRPQRPARPRRQPERRCRRAAASAPARRRKQRRPRLLRLGRREQV